MARPKLHDDALRVRLLDRAAELLSDEGPEALSLRRLATDVGTSTTAVYSLFGGKPALLQAVYNEAFRRFGEHLGSVEPSADPRDDLLRLAIAYRASALDDPHMYAVMFGRRTPGFEPKPEVQERAAATFAPLVDAVRRGIAAGVLGAADTASDTMSGTASDAGGDTGEATLAGADRVRVSRTDTVDPVTLAAACWATAHGVVSLEIGGFLPPDAGDPERLFGAVVRAVTRGWGQGWAAAGRAAAGQAAADQATADQAAAGRAAAASR